VNPREGSLTPGGAEAEGDMEGGVALGMLTPYSWSSRLVTHPLPPKNSMRPVSHATPLHTPPSLL